MTEPTTVERRQRMPVTSTAPDVTSKVTPESQPPSPPKRPRTPTGGGRKPKQPSKKHWGRRIVLLLLMIVLLSGGVFGYKILAAGNKISTTDRSILGQLKDLLFSQGKVLNGETEDRINIMLLAVGGEGHSGQNLADTVMVASIRPSDNQVALLSIPRDLYVQVPGEQYYSKINAVHAYGESKEKNGGPALLAKTVEEVTSLPIHYYGRIDFTAFKQIVDSVGGINITIENSFFDYWHKISFSAGTEKMDGERALAYVRARYVEGPEGGDFKRAERQQQALLALQDKVFSVNTALDFTALNGILDSLSSNIRTDMQLWEMKRLYELARLVDRQNVHSVVLTTGPRGVLVGSTEVLGGTPASILKTRTGNYAEIHSLAQNIFSSSDARVISPPPNANVESAQTETEAIEAAPTPDETPDIAKPSVEIRNGTNTTGLAKETSDKLQAQGYEVTAIGNAATRGHTTTTVYVLNDDMSEGAKVLAEEVNASVKSGLPSEESASNADTLLILGEDAN